MKLPYNNSIKITVPPDDKKDSDGDSLVRGSDAFGPIFTRPQSQFLPRRIMPGGVKIFDLGQIVLNGENITVNTNFLPVMTPYPTATGYAGGPLLADYTATCESLKSAVTGLFYDEETKFYEIKKGDTRYEKNVRVNFPKDGNPNYEAALNDAPEWTDKGLKISAEQAQNLTIKTFGVLFNSFEITLSEMKVTIEPNFNAPAFPFTPSAKMEIYLFPALIYHFARMEYANGLLMGATFNDYKIIEDFVGFILHLMPRTALAVDSINEFMFDYFSLTPYQQQYKQFLAMMETENLRVLRGTQTLSAGDPTEYVYTHTTGDISEIPFQPIYQPNAPVNSQDVFNKVFQVNSGLVLLDSFEGNNSTRLKAIIKQGKDIYYLWQT